MEKKEVKSTRIIPMLLLLASLVIPRVVAMEMASFQDKLKKEMIDALAAKPEIKISEQEMRRMIESTSGRLQKDAKMDQQKADKLAKELFASARVQADTKRKVGGLFQVLSHPVQSVVGWLISNSKSIEERLFTAAAVNERTQTAIKEASTDPKDPAKRQEAERLAAEQTKAAQEQFDKIRAEADERPDDKYAAEAAKEAEKGLKLAEKIEDNIKAQKFEETQKLNTQMSNQIVNVASASVGALINKVPAPTPVKPPVTKKVRCPKGKKGAKCRASQKAKKKKKKVTRKVTSRRVKKGKKSRK